MKEFVFLVILVGAGIWLHNSLKPQALTAQPVVREQREQRPIIIAPASSQSGPGEESRNRSLAEDDIAMAEERRRSWKNQTSRTQTDERE
jgi:hypothetical protein